jgi:hypothetical protein
MKKAHKNVFDKSRVQRLLETPRGGRVGGYIM